MKETYRVLFNACFGGFSLSEEAKKRAIECGYNKEVLRRCDWNLELRSSPIMLRVFDELGPERFSGSSAKIAFRNVPDIYAFTIGEYDGLEEVLLKPKRDYLLKLMSAGKFEEVLKYLEKSNCLRGEV